MIQGNVSSIGHIRDSRFERFEISIEGLGDISLVNFGPNREAVVLSLVEYYKLMNELAELKVRLQGVQVKPSIIKEDRFQLIEIE